MAAPVLACVSVVGWGATFGAGWLSPLLSGVLPICFRWFVLVVCLVIHVVGVRGGGRGVLGPRMAVLVSPIFPKTTVSRVYLITLRYLDLPLNWFLITSAASKEFSNLFLIYSTLLPQRGQIRELASLISLK